MADQGFIAKTNSLGNIVRVIAADGGLSVANGNGAAGDPTLSIDTTGASEGDVLTIVSGAPSWEVAGAGSGITQLTGEVTAGPGTGSQAATIASGLAATKLADGSVSNTEFQYLGNVTSDIQTQLDAKMPTTNFHPKSMARNVFGGPF